MTETHDLQNEQRAPLIEVSLKVAVDNASTVQRKLAEFGLSSLVAGGVAVDLLAVKHLPDHKPRFHSDVELIVPIAERGRLVDVINEIGFDNPSSIHSGDVHFASLAVKGVKYDIFFSYGNEDHTYAPLCYLGKRRNEAVEIDNKPMKVDYTGHSLQVLSPQSLLAIKSGFGLGNQADIETLKKIINTI